MKLSNFEIANMHAFLAKLATGEEQPVMPVRTSYRIGKILKTMDSHNQDFEKARTQLIEKYADKDEDGNYKNPEDEEGNKEEGKILLTDPQKYNQELIELGQDEVEINFNVLLTVEDLEALNEEFSVADVMVLDPVIKEEA